MAFDEGLAQRIRECLEDEPGLSERRMFGGLAFLFQGNLGCGVVGDSLMVRVGPDAYEEALALPHAREMDFTGRPMRGLLFVAPAGVEDDDALGGWVERGARFARSLPRK